LDADTSFIVTVASGFEEEAGWEIKGILEQAVVHRLFFKGTVLVKSSLGEDDAVEKLRDAETTYVGKVYPVDSRAKISREKESLATIYDEISRLSKLDDNDTFLIDCRRRGSHDFTSRDVGVEVGSRLEEETGATVDFESPRKTVVVQIFQDTAYVGVTDTVNLLTKEIKRFRKYAKGTRPFTRAEHKIREAFDEFGIEIGEEHDVLDIGAAPGGWTRHLAGRAGRVVAVDLADLHPSLSELANVTHVRRRAEDLPEDIGRFDFITNDMNVSPSESAEIMNGLADLLKEGGAALMTIKFVTRARRRHIDEALETLDKRYTDFRVKRLPHNRNETTVYMRVR
jgi:23S rRNA (cytidine2498-2'-O)-methyltransferase